MAIAYGLEVQPENDPYIEIATQANHLVTLAAVPGAFLVDSFPFLKHLPEWMPGAGFKRKAREWSKVSQAVFDIPSKAAKDQIVISSFFSCQAEAEHRYFFFDRTAATTCRPSCRIAILTSMRARMSIGNGT